jgi:diadenosine tetraphosphate (Ap4A) HIT family hydrolase
MECPFCNITSERTRILKEGKFVRVIFSNPYLMRGHLLVVPKRHVEKISELNNKEREELFNLLIEFQEKILGKVSSGCDIRQNYRPFQEQNKFKVHHLHFHLQPRELFDELYKKYQIFEKDIFKDLSSEELDL